MLLLVVEIIRFVDSRLLFEFQPKGDGQGRSSSSLFPPTQTLRVLTSTPSSQGMDLVYTSFPSRNVTTVMEGRWDLGTSRLSTTETVSRRHQSSHPCVVTIPHLSRPFHDPDLVIGSVHLSLVGGFMVVDFRIPSVRFLPFGLFSSSSVLPPKLCRDQVK